MSYVPMDINFPSPVLDHLVGKIIDFNIPKPGEPGASRAVGKDYDVMLPIEVLTTGHYTFRHFSPSRNLDDAMTALRRVNRPTDMHYRGDTCEVCIHDNCYGFICFCERHFAKDMTTAICKAVIGLDAKIHGKLRDYCKDTGE